MIASTNSFTQKSDKAVQLLRFFRARMAHYQAAGQLTMARAERLQYLINRAEYLTTASEDAQRRFIDLQSDSIRSFLPTQGSRYYGKKMHLHILTILRECQSATYLQAAHDPNHRPKPSTYQLTLCL